MTRCWWSTRSSSGWAAATPLRASASTSSGLLISFFMSDLRRNGRGGNLGGTGVGCLLRCIVLRGVRDDPEEDGCGHAGQQLRGDVHRPLLPADVATQQLLDEHRPGGAGRV